MTVFVLSVKVGEPQPNPYGDDLISTVELLLGETLVGLSHLNTTETETETQRAVSGLVNILRHQTRDNCSRH